MRYLASMFLLTANTALVRAPGEPVNGLVNAGAVYVVSTRPGNWAVSEKLFGQYVEEESLFGSSVAYSFEHAIIGSPGADANLGIDSGAVDIIENNGGVWFRYPEGRPVPDHYNDNVGFGAGVDISENELIISATQSDSELDMIYSL